MSLRIARLSLDGGSRLDVPAERRHPLLSLPEARLLRIIQDACDSGDLCRMTTGELARRLDRSHQRVLITRGVLRRWGLIEEGVTSHPGVLCGSCIGIRITEFGREVLEAQP